MLLKLKNVGRLKSAEVKINGITVICGNNNTGKSTVGKILYCICDSLHNLEESILNEKIKSIARAVFFIHSSYRFIHDIDFISLTIERYKSDILTAINSGKTGKYITSMLIKLLDSKISESDHQKLSDRIDTILKTSAKEIVSNFIKRRIIAEFGDKLGNVSYPQVKTYAELRIKNDSITFSYFGDSKKLISDKFFSLRKKLIYIDDPFIIDDINDRLSDDKYTDNYRHRSRILEMLRKSVYRTEQTSIEEIIDSKKIRMIINTINSVSDGELVFEESNFVYKHSKLRESLSLQSVSTGIKTFIVIKKLLQDRILEENGIAVFDEPEVHLHPEWQIKFAEIIVMLHKAYGLNILLTTHSMEFLSAIDYFSKKHGIENVCSYYLTELEKAKSKDDFPDAVIHEMTDDKEKLYASISAPFLALYNQMGSENEIY